VVGVPRTHDVISFLGLTRGADAPAFGMIDCETISELLPHLAHTFQILHPIARR
jgi:hypothetical protein